MSSAPFVPPPVPRRVRKLPVVAMVLASLAGFGLFLFLWDVAVQLQQQVIPSRRVGTFEQPLKESSEAP